jgi:hypothetical protein
MDIITVETRRPVRRKIVIIRIDRFRIGYPVAKVELENGDWTGKDGIEITGNSGGWSAAGIKCSSSGDAPFRGRFPDWSFPVQSLAAIPSTPLDFLINHSIAGQQKCCSADVFFCFRISSKIRRFMRAWSDGQRVNRREGYPGR